MSLHAITAIYGTERIQDAELLRWTKENTVPTQEARETAERRAQSAEPHESRSKALILSLSANQSPNARRSERMDKPAYTALLAQAEREIQARILHMALYGTDVAEWRYTARRAANHLHQGI